MRLSDAGYQAPGDRTHIQVLVNPATWHEDLAALEPGTVVIWNENAKMEMTRDDVISYPVPMSALARKINPKIAKLVTNIIYVGIIAEMLGIDQGALESAVAKQFKGKETICELTGATTYDRVVGYCSVDGVDFGKMMMDETSLEGLLSS